MRRGVVWRVVLVLLVAAMIAVLFLRRPSDQSASVPKVIDGMNDASDEGVLQSLADYRRWRLVNPEPYNANVIVTALCAPSAPSRSPDDPHVYRKDRSVSGGTAFIRVFANASAEGPMFEQTSPHFPLGSVIVKEKLPTKESQTPELLTVMIKREAGFNPKLGDWEFLAVDGDAKRIQARGRLENCQRCHETSPESDFVFRDYLPGAVAE